MINEIFDDLDITAIKSVLFDDFEGGTHVGRTAPDSQRVIPVFGSSIAGTLDGGADSADCIFGMARRSISMHP